MHQDFSTALIICTCKNPTGLESTLLSIQRQTSTPSRVYIAEDGLEEQTLEVIQRFSKSLAIEHVRQKHEGFRKAAIMNKAIARAIEDYLVFVDGDEVLHPRFVEDHISAASKGTTVLGTRCHLSGFHGRIVRRAPNPLDLMFLFATGRVERPTRIERTRPRKRSQVLKMGLRLRKAEMTPCTPNNAVGGNMASWRQDLLQVNGFDEMFEGWGDEDVDLVTRQSRNGVIPVKLRFHAICYHLNHPLAPANPRNRGMAGEDRPTRCENGISKHLNQVSEPEFDQKTQGKW